MLALASMNAMTDPVRLTFACHPQTPSQAVHGIDAVVAAARGGSISLTFVLMGDLSGLRIPATLPSRRAGKLWQHTCFEVFVMAGEGPGYREFNFSPSVEWAVYAFRNYRDGGTLEAELEPEIVVRRTMNRLELDAKIGRDSLPQGSSLRLGLSAVVEDAYGELSYWALQHPPGKPDFHHPDAFALQLELP